MRRFAASLSALVGFGALGVACVVFTGASDLPAAASEDASPADGESAVDTEGEVGGDVSADTAAADADSSPSCDPTARPDPTSAVFVDETVGTATSPGTSDQPLDSLAHALAAAQAAPGTIARVYVAPGRYAESIVVPPLSTSLTISGGWNVSGAGTTTASWTQECDVNKARALVTFASPTTTGVLADGITHGLTLQELTISTADAPTTPAARAESTYGLLAKNGSVVTLEGVVIVAGAGGVG